MTVQMIMDGTNGLTFPDSSRMASIPRSYLAGLTLSTAGSSATFGIAAGQATDSTNIQVMLLTSAFTKTTSAWAVGSGNGALDTGSIANSTWYHVYLIRRSDTGVVDVLISTSASAPTMPTNYDQKRRIGSILTNGSAQWVNFYQNGDEFLWNAPVGDYNGSSLGTTATLLTLSVPLGVVVKARFNAQSGKGAAQPAVIMWSPSVATQVSGTPTGNYQLASQAIGSYDVGFFDILTNTSSQVYAISDTASSSIWVITNGWIDRRGRDA